MDGQTQDASTTHYLHPSPVNEAFTPDYRDYGVFRMDPLASVAHLDQPAKEAAAGLPRRFYVAHLNMAIGIPAPAPQKETNHCNITLLRQGLPAPRDGLPDSSMCVPVLPNASHPLGRQPLQPTRPLPWPDCYHETLPDGVDVRITTTMRPYGNVTKLPLEERQYLCRMRDEDERRVADIYMNSLTVRLVPKSNVPDGLASDEEDVAITSRNGSESLSLLHERSQVGAHSNKSDVSVIASDNVSELANISSTVHSLDTIDDIHIGADDESLPVVDVWYDLGMVFEVTDPVHFYEEREALKQIILEAYARQSTSSVTAPLDRLEARTSAFPSLRSRIRTKSRVLTLVRNIAKEVGLALRRLRQKTHYKKLRSRSR